MLQDLLAVPGLPESLKVKIKENIAVVMLVAGDEKPVSSDQSQSSTKSVADTNKHVACLVCMENHGAICMIVATKITS